MDSVRLKNIVSSISQGNENSFKELFNFLYPSLLNYACYILDSRSVSEEIVSSVFVKLWEDRKKMGRIANIRSYLFVSVKNLSYNYIRDNKRFLISDPGETTFPMLKTFETPESLFLDRELRDLVHRSIEELPEKCKMIFKMVRDDELKYNEVARLLDISIKTVEAQMCKAIAKIRAVVKSYSSDVSQTKKRVLAKRVFLFVF